MLSHPNGLAQEAEFPAGARAAAGHGGEIGGSSVQCSSGIC